MYSQSREFVSDGPAPDVQIHSTCVQVIHHPVIGDLDLSLESFPLAG
jgi:hypothetical protein